MMMKIKLENKN